MFSTANHLPLPEPIEQDPDFAALLDLLEGGGAALVERTDVVLRGPVEALPPTGAPAMPNDSHVSLRLPTELTERLDALVDALQDDPQLCGARVSRQVVMRRALTIGVLHLEGGGDPGAIPARMAS